MTFKIIADTNLKGGFKLFIDLKTLVGKKC